MSDLAIDSKANNDYRVSIKIRNANILRAIESLGYKTPSEFSKAEGINYQTLTKLISLKESPLRVNGDYKPLVMKLCDVLRKMPSELFSENQLYPVKTNSFEVDMDSANVSLMKLGKCPSTLIDSDNSLSDAISTLTTREQDVINRRFGIYGAVETLEQIASSYGITSNRIRQIEAKGLMKLRKPERSNNFRHLYCD